MPPKSRVLAAKEATLFKELLTLYETRQLKKGLKTADQILKKFPDHGETTCMKGLILVHVGKREEGLENVKKGMRLDLTSHICWHVFGLIQKGEKKYEEALKSYSQALRFDKENLNILRDSAQLQTQLRLFDNLVDTRHVLLALRPAMRQNWLALAVAYHLQGNAKEARHVLQTYIEMLKSVPDYDVEHSMVALYYIAVLEDSGDEQTALTVLDEYSRNRVIVDKVSSMEIKARLLTKCGAKDEAEDAWRALLEHNPENYAYYAGFLINRDRSPHLLADLASTQAYLTRIPEDRWAHVLSMFRNFSEQYTKAVAPRRLALEFARGDEFESLARAYILDGLRRGIPSLFTDVKSLYQSTEKCATIETLVEGQRVLLIDPESKTQAPATYLWTLYYLAQHYSHLRQNSKALSLVEEALTHTPTLAELHTCKARILKRAGDLFGAAKSLNDARLLDGQDRFLNTKCAKYWLRAGLIDEANELLGLFTKKDAPSPGQDLEDMQSMLYLIEEGNALAKQKRLGSALKKYVAISKIFDEIDNDQYDFHGYCIRKYTFGIYHNLIEWENGLRANSDYAKAAIAAAKIWVAVHDDPTVAQPPHESTPDSSKKTKKKAKKAAQKVQDTTKKALNPNANSNEDKGLEPPEPKDEDPDGVDLIKSADALTRAHQLLAPLSTFSANDIDYWIVFADVARRRGQRLQSLRYLLKAKQLSPEHPELHLRIAQLHKTEANGVSAEGVSSRLVKEATDQLLPTSVSLATFNSLYVQKHSPSAFHLLGAAKVALLLESPTNEIEDLIMGGEVSDIEVALSTAALLKNIQSGRLEEYKAKCESAFPLSTVFKPHPSAEETGSWTVIVPDEPVHDNAQEVIQ